MFYGKTLFGHHNSLKKLLTFIVMSNVTFETFGDSFLPLENSFRLKDLKEFTKNESPKVFTLEMNIARFSRKNETFLVFF